MSSIMSVIQAAAHSAARSVRGELVTYTRTSAGISIEMTAVKGSTNWDATAPHPNYRVGDRSTDWLITAAELVDADGNALEPVRGDTITAEDGTVYRVMPFGPDSQLWQWHDRTSKASLRVHTKERS